jgi:hypothetical protein
VSYHGTGEHDARRIAEDGFDLTKGKRFLFGKGIYTTPDIAIAQLYATKFTYKKKTYKIVIQNRVNPKNLEIIVKEGAGEYWISPSGCDVRPYGVCIQECDEDSESGSGDEMSESDDEESESCDEESAAKI